MFGQILSIETLRQGEVQSVGAPKQIFISCLNCLLGDTERRVRVGHGYSDVLASSRPRITWFEVYDFVEWILGAASCCE